jgi:hypothetical protein
LLTPYVSLFIFLKVEGKTQTLLELEVLHQHHKVQLIGIYCLIKLKDYVSALVFQLLLPQVLEMSELLKVKLKNLKAKLKN